MAEKDATHYLYEVQKPIVIPHKAVFKLRTMMKKKYKEGLIQREINDSRPPIINDQEIRFNGVGDLGNETCYYSVLFSDLETPTGQHITSCRTNGKPYDEIVKRVYLTLGYFIPGIRIKSNEFFKINWTGARDWARRRGMKTYITDTVEFYI